MNYIQAIVTSKPVMGREGLAMRRRPDSCPAGSWATVSVGGGQVED